MQVTLSVKYNLKLKCIHVRKRTRWSDLFLGLLKSSREGLSISYRKDS